MTHPHPLATTGIPTLPKPLRVALYGGRAHQIHAALVDHGSARLVATAAFPIDRLPEPLAQDSTVRHHPDLAALLADDDIDLVSVCSPRCRDQAQHVIDLLASGKHVYAEKPLAMSERDLDRVLEAAQRHGRVVREMAGTAFDQPYLALRELVGRGTLGTVVQVLAQKSYPLFPHRPQDEDQDGGLLLQVGVHAARMVEHVARQHVVDIHSIETQTGNVHDASPDRSGGLRIACSFQMRLSNGGIATAIANYCNPPGFGRHGNETLRVFGSEGMAEITDGGQCSRIVIGDTDRGPLDTTASAPPYHDRLFAFLCDGVPMPVSSADELHPLRVVLRARRQRESPKP